MPKRETLRLEQLSTEIRSLYDVLNQVSKDSDIACVVVGAAFLDSVLASLLHAKLRNSSITDKLLETDRGALGGFQSRADLAYCMSLIEKEQYQDLCKIAEIRNLFAHSRLHLSFNEVELQDMCNQLKQWMVIEDGEQELPTNATAEGLRMIAKNKFDFSVVLLANNLLLKGLGLKRSA